MDKYFPGMKNKYIRTYGNAYDRHGPNTVSYTHLGAGFWSKNIHITVPAMKGIIAPAVIMTTFTTFKQFDIVYLLTMQKGCLLYTSRCV